MKDTTGHKGKAFLKLACSLGALGFCLACQGQPPTSATSPELAASPAPPVAQEALHHHSHMDAASRTQVANAAEENALPELLPIAEEPILQDVLTDYLSCLQSKAPLDVSQGLLLLSRAVDALPDQPTAEKLFMYKYPLRFLTESLLANSACSPAAPELQPFTQGTHHWQPRWPSWEFPPYEEATYAALFKPSLAPTLPSPGVTGHGSPQWACRVILAIRLRDIAAMEKLHAEAQLGEAPQWPLEVYRQIFTYATTRGGEEQLHTLQKLLKGRSLRGAAWAEVGYGNGKIFTPLRQLLGPQAALYGVEIDDSSKVHCKLLQQSGLAGWGSITWVDSTYSDCCLPPHSVDYIHPGLLHIGDGPQQLLAKDWLPLLNSFKKALKPGGWLIIDDGGDPPIERVRQVLTMAGFVEVAYYVVPNPKAPTPIFVAAFRVK